MTRRNSSCPAGPPSAAAPLPAPGLRRRTGRQALALGLSAGLLASMVPLSAATAAPNIGDGGPASYLEQAAPAPVGTDVMITSAGSGYGGGHVDFEVGGAGASEFLSLQVDGEPAATAGVVSVVEGSVYLGNGATADIIGSVDPDFDGRNGRKLRINFTSPFVNPSFEDGELGWTLMEQWINLGETVIAGHRSQDTSNYDISTQSNGPVVNTNDDRQPTSGYGSDPLAYIAEVWGGDAKQGSYSLHLESSMKTVQQCDIVHGPAAHSAEFEASAGDQIYFDWKASGSGDNTHVFGYIVDRDGNQIEVLDATTPLGSTPWTEKSTTIDKHGFYRFVFVAGTFDYTCGTKAGASLLVDNVRVYGSKVNDAVLQGIVHKLQYENTSDDPEAVRTVNVTAVDSASGTDTGAITVNITPVDDPTVLDDIPAAVFTNNEGPQDFDAVAGALSAADPDDDIAYGIAGGIADAATIGGIAYTHSLKGAYGTLHVNRDTGAYVFVPADDAIDARQDGGSETFSFTASAGGKTVQKPFTVDVVVPATAPAAPAGPKAAAGPERVDLTWKAPSWTGGAPVTGYRIEQSTDGGTTWSVVEQNTGSTDTRYSAKGLANGREASFRISAVNRNGTGPSSQVVTATPLDVPGAPVDVTAAPADRKVEVSWTAPKNDGGAPVTGYRIEQSTDGGTTWTVVEQNTGSTGTRYSAEGLANGRTVSFRIAAINAAGTGKVSNEAAAAPRTVPGAAAGLKAAAGDGQVKLTWTAPEDDGGAPVTGYRIEQYNPETKTWRAAGATKDAKTSYTVTGLPNGVEAAFRVSPVNDAGTGKAGSAAAATPRTVPGAAEITGIEPGNRKLTVEFDGPSSDGGAEITGYEYSLDGGETWNTAGDGSGPLVIDGLNNGEDYSVLVRAVNAAGAGAPSEAVEASPERAPVPDESGTGLPEVPAGDTELLVDGAAEPFTISLENGTWTVTGDGFSIDLEAVNGDGAKLAIDDDGRLVVIEGGALRLRGAGFKAGSRVDVWLLNNQDLLGEVTVAADGTFEGAFELPEGVGTGSDTVQINGVSPDGELRSLSAGLVVLAGSAEPELAATGAGVHGLALLAAALLGLGTAGAFAGRRKSAARRGGSPVS